MYILCFIRLNLNVSFSLQCQHSDGQRRHARLLGRSRGTPGSAQVPRARGRRFAVRPGQRRYGARSRRRSDGMSQLSKVDGKHIEIEPHDGCRV